MAIEAAQTAVSTTPVLLTTGGTNGVSILIQNVSATTAYLGGGTTVSGTTGAQFLGTATLAWYVEQGEDLYAVTTSGTATIHVIKGGVSQ